MAEMISPFLMKEIGLLPIRKGPARFAVGSPDGLTSNSWIAFANNKGDVFISCRDSFKEVKVSLHTSGRWRIGFTQEAIAKKPQLVAPGQNRAWEVWDEPPSQLPQTVIALHLFFPTSELAVRHEQRPQREWSEVFFIEAGPPGKLTALTLFVTTGNNELKHESEPSFCLASWDIGQGRYAKLLVHGDPEGTIPETVDRCVAQARAQAEAAGIAVPQETYGYFFGRRENGSRFLVGARMHRPK